MPFIAPWQKFNLLQTLFRAAEVVCLCKKRLPPRGRGCECRPVDETHKQNEVKK